MNDCPNMAQCRFFNVTMAESPGMARVFKERYCNATYSECARFILKNALGKEHVPQDLFPSQVDRAQSIIDAA